MAELFIWLIVGALAIWLAVLVAWTLAALLAQALSFLVLYWMVAFTLSVVAGLLFGVAIPLRVLRGRGRAPFRQLTPQAVVEGTAFAAKPKGESRHYGWDRAWPTYVPYQAREDALAVRAECADVLHRLWRQVARVSSLGSARQSAAATKSAKVASAAGATARSVPGLVMAALLIPPYAGFFLGVWASVLAWVCLMFLSLGMITAVQRLALVCFRWSDILLRRHGRAELKCPHCYHRSTLPSYRCSNPSCQVVHRTLLPGPLGLHSRRCECGAKLPNTVRGAAARLEPLCPVCNRPLAAGSGNRQTIQLPVIGAVGAGKTRLLAAATVQLEQRLGELGGSVEGLTPQASTFLEVARGLIRQHANTTKTATASPAGVPLLLKEPGGKFVELQLMDAAGENFADWTQTAALRYLDEAHAMIFVVDPLSFPEIARQLRSRGLAQAVLTATGEQEDAYAAAVDRMRSENVKLKNRELAFVLTKADMLFKLPVGEQLATRDSVGVRDWLLSNQFDLLVQRCEKDFAKVTYFVVDSMDTTNALADTSPLRAIEWVLQVCKSPIATALAPPHEPAGTTGTEMAVT